MKSKSFKIGLNPERLKTSSPSWVLPISAGVFILKYSEITVPLTHLTCKGTAWDFSDKCHYTFTSLKKAFTTAPIIAHWIHWLLRQMPQTMPSLPSFPLYLWLTMRSIQLLFTLGPLPHLNSTSRSMTRNYLPFLKLSKFGVITSRDLRPWYIWWQIIKILSISLPLNYSPATKSVSWSEFLCQFNLIIWFCPGHLSTKPDTLTRWWDVYPKEGGSNYASINQLTSDPCSCKNN